jgi:oligopeptide transport system substrate-binding protein
VNHSFFSLALFGLATTICACSEHAGEPTTETKYVELRRGLGGEPASLDPATATDTFSFQVIQDVYEGLTRETAAGEVVPAVAASWTVDPDGKTYTFQLRSDAFWSNGKPVRAEEFVSSWQRVLDPKQSSTVSNELRLIAGATAILSGKAQPTSLGVTALSSNILIVKLEQPAPYFPQLLAHSAAFPVYSNSSAHSHESNTWVSNGPYVLSSWQPGTSLELVRNVEYWDRANVKIQHVSYQIAPDQNAQFAAYRAGQLDLTDTVPTNAVAKIRAERPQELIIAPYSATAYYGLNITDPPLQGNLKLRKALSMAIDRRRIVTALSLGQVSAYGFVPPGTWNYDSQKWDWERLSDSERIAEARRLYSQAGYSISVPLRLRLLLNSNPSIKQTAIMVGAMWKETLGIEAIVTDEEFRVFLQSRHDRQKWDVLRLAWNADYNDATSFLDIFRTKSSNNDTGYANPAFDKLLDDAANTADPAIRRGLLESAERILLADYPGIPLYFLVSKRLVKPYVLGVKPTLLDRLGSKELIVLPH